MASAYIAPASLGVEHIDRLIEVGWPIQIGNKAVRTSARGILSRVAHQKSGTTLTLELGLQSLTVTLGANDADVTLIDG